MNRKIYQQLEQSVLDAFPMGSSIELNNVLYTVSVAGKPAARSGGEGKTDVYLLLVPSGHHQSTTDDIEIKLSVKAHNADWFENKMSQDRFSQVFSSAERREALADESVRRTTELAHNGRIVLSGDDYVVLGYKLDIIGAHATGHTNSFEVELTSKEAHEILSGSKLDAKKRHGFVNGVRREDSGAVNYLLRFADNSFTSLPQRERQDFILNNMISVNDYVRTPTNCVFRLKLSALSYGQRGSVRELSRKLFLTNAHAVDNGGIVSWIDPDQDLFNRRARDVVKTLPADVRAKIEG